jgi:DNA helicase II / ATP-dependent DNA helicase PcrA
VEVGVYLELRGRLHTVGCSGRKHARDRGRTRLLYVAMTRAKDHLQIIVPQRFYATQQRGNGDRQMYAVRTRFIPDTITKHFEQRAWPPTACELGATPKATSRPVDIAARVKSKWR